MMLHTLSIIRYIRMVFGCTMRCSWQIRTELGSKVIELSIAFTLSWPSRCLLKHTTITLHSSASRLTKTLVLSVHRVNGSHILASFSARMASLDNLFVRIAGLFKFINV